MNEPTPPSKPSLLRTIKAMAWAFLGVRKGAEWHNDSAQMTPLLVVVVGLVAIFVFVLLLILIVNWVV